MQAAVRKCLPAFRNPPPPAGLAPFHSTPISLAAGWNSKTSIRFSVREKRKDERKALKDFIIHGKSPRQQLEGGDIGPRGDKGGRRKATSRHGSDGFDKEPKSTGYGTPKLRGSVYGKSKHAGSKRWKNKQSFYYEDDYGPQERVFQASFGGHNRFTWSFPSFEDPYFEDSKTGFEWRGEPKQEKDHRKAHRRLSSESDMEDESTDEGLHSHRLVLGLPTTGPLKLDDIKSAFHASALKWHPDKHYGPSKARAEEKFKLCVDAYRSLCSVLNSN